MRAPATAAGHLRGATLFTSRFTALLIMELKCKWLLLQSMCEGTRLLLRRVAQMPKPNAARLTACQAGDIVAKRTRWIEIPVPRFLNAGVEVVGGKPEQVSAAIKSGIPAMRKVTEILASVPNICRDGLRFMQLPVRFYNG